MVNFILIALCILSGYLLKRLRVLPDGAHRGINIWILYLAVPAVALKYIPTISWSTDLLLPAVMPVIVWAGSWLTFCILSRRIPMDDATRTALTLTAGLGNTSFLGFPLIQAYYGDHALPIAVICDQLSFLMMSTLGATMAMANSRTGSVTAGLVIKKLFQFPPFVASVIALILPHFINLSLITPLFDKIAATLVPLALFSVGMQLSFAGWKKEVHYLIPGISYKLIIAPMLILIVIVAFHLKGPTPQISLFEASMAPMITAGVIAAQYDLNPQLANLMVGLGILISFVTTGLWYLILQYIC